MKIWRAEVLSGEKLAWWDKVWAFKGRKDELDVGKDKLIEVRKSNNGYLCCLRGLFGLNINFILKFTEFKPEKDIAFLKEEKKPLFNCAIFEITKPGEEKLVGQFPLVSELSEELCIYKKIGLFSNVMPDPFPIVVKTKKKLEVDSIIDGDSYESSKRLIVMHILKLFLMKSLSSKFHAFLFLGKFNQTNRSFKDYLSFLLFIFIPFSLIWFILTPPGFRCFTLFILTCIMCYIVPQIRNLLIPWILMYNIHDLKDSLLAYKPPNSNNTIYITYLTRGLPSEQKINESLEVVHWQLAIVSILLVLLLKLIFLFKGV